MQYHNPILPGMFPDPSMAVVNGTYYLANSTFQYYPGIALSKSTDLLHWTRLPGAERTSVQADLRTAKSNEGIFAVNLRYHNGWFYAITTNFAEFKTLILRGQIQGDSIVWEPTRITVDLQGIDPDLFFEDGHVYIQFTGYIDNHGTKAIQQVEINLENGEILAGPRVLTLGTGSRDVEGPHIIHKNGWYYLLIAEGG
ncbi:MAG: family 43 glycosylhydrolase, partial [Schleiferilactobacillus harbinensis]